MQKLAAQSLVQIFVIPKCGSLGVLLINTLLGYG